MARQQPRKLKGVIPEASPAGTSLLSRVQSSRPFSNSEAADFAMETERRERWTCARHSPEPGEPSCLGVLGRQPGVRTGR